MLINQVIYTIQCEGPNIGKPSILVRTQGCNLKCPWCDTKQSWDTNKGFGKKIVNERIIQIFENYTNIQNIMLTGGEPMYNNFEDILNYFTIDSLLKNCNIEIETNGTLIKKNGNILKKYKDNIFLNISPKLDTTCFPKRYQEPEALDYLYSINIKTVKELDLNYNMKFVYDSKDCFCENNIHDFILRNKININNVSIMSLTENGKDVDIENCKNTIEFCKRNGFRYTPRLHLMIYGNDINENSI